MDTQEYIAYQRSIKSYRDIKSGEISSFELGMEKGEIRATVKQRIEAPGSNR